MNFIKFRKHSFPPVYIPIESVKRELEAKMLVATELLTTGHIIIIGREDLVNAYAAIGPKGSFWFKNPAHARYRLAKALSARHMLFLLDEEAGIIHADQHRFVRARYCPELMPFFDTIGAWSTSQHDALCDIFSLDGNVKCTGSPRLDLMVNQKRRKPGKKRKILFSSNFSIIKNVPNRIKRRLKISGSSGREKIAAADIDKWLKTENARAENFKAMLAEISKEFDDCDFIIRPHPGEGSSSFWGDIVDKSDNIYFDKNLTLTKSISEADVILHSGCTAAIDGAIQGVPSIDFTPVESNGIPANQSEISRNLSYQCWTIAEVNKTLRAVLQKPELKPSSSLVLKRFSNVMDGQCYLRVAKELVSGTEMALKHRSFPPFVRIIRNISSFPQWKNLFRAYVPWLTPGGRWALQKVPQRSVASLDRFIDDQIEPKTIKIKVELICPGLFLLSKDT